MTCVTDLMQMMTVTASADESVRSAATRMAALRIEYLPVLSSKGNLIGLLRSWDVHRAHPNRLVVDAMITNLVFISSQATIWEAYQISEDENTEYLVSLDRETPVGIITRTALEVAVARQTDALTGLPTATYMRKRLDFLWNSGQEVYLIFVDINEFGLINKRLGHVIGDHILVKLSQILSSITDPTLDVLCRYGGDEFAIVANRSKFDAQKLADTLVSEVTQAANSFGSSLNIAVGIAGGRYRALRHQDPTPIDNLINLASRASTEAKRAESGILLVDIAAGT
jgi:IMP dehydrogenase